MSKVNVNKNQQQFILLYDRYKKACGLLGIKPKKFYYEKGYVKNDSLKKAKRLSTFEKKIVEEIELQVRNIPQQPEVKPATTPVVQSVVEDTQPQQKEPTTSKKTWWKFW